MLGEGKTSRPISSEGGKIPNTPISRNINHHIIKSNGTEIKNSNTNRSKEKKIENLIIYEFFLRIEQPKIVPLRNGSSQKSPNPQDSPRTRRNMKVSRIFFIFSSEEQMNIQEIERCKMGLNCLSIQEAQKIFLGT